MAGGCLLALLASALDLDGDPSRNKAVSFELVADVTRRTVWKLDLFYRPARVAHQVLDSGAVVTAEVAGQKPVGGWYEVHESQFVQDFQRAVHADNVDSAAFPHDLPVDGVRIEGPLGVGKRGNHGFPGVGEPEPGLCEALLRLDFKASIGLLTHRYGGYQRISKQKNAPGPCTMSATLGKLASI